MPSTREAFIRHAIDALIEAERCLPSDVSKALASTVKAETSERAKEQLQAILEKVKLAAGAGLPMCKDNGVPIYFLEIGREASIDFSLKEALASAVQRATDLIPLRKHAVDPITRPSSDEPLFDILCDVCDGDEVSVAVLVKGAGSENVSALAVLEPTQDVVSFVLNTIWQGGGNRSHHLSSDLASAARLMAVHGWPKKTLFRSLDEKESAFEAEILEQIKKLGIGPMGLGGRTTALRVFRRKGPLSHGDASCRSGGPCWADRKARFRIKL